MFNLNTFLIAYLYTIILFLFKEVELPENKVESVLKD